MKTRTLLDQLLRSGQAALQPQGRSPQASQRLPPSPGFGAGSSPLGGLGGLGGLAGGSLASGALSALLGSRRLGRKRHRGGGLLSHGGVALLGVMAYRAWTEWQKQQATAPKGDPRTIDRVSPDEAELHSRAILRALVAAAKADGHVDERERQLLDQELSRAGADAEARAWLDAELKKPLDPAEIATDIDSPELAAEVYIASRMIIDEESFMERAYLDELARRLNLDAGLRASLDRQASQTGTA